MMEWFWEGMRVHRQKYPQFVWGYFIFIVLAFISELLLLALGILAIGLFHYYFYRPDFYFYLALCALLFLLAGKIHFFFRLYRERLYHTQ